MQPLPPYLPPLTPHLLSLICPMTSVKKIKKVLKQTGITPNKRLGQVFLASRKTKKAVIKASRLDKKDAVVEVGPGLGALTKEIVKKAGKVTAIEKDPRLVQFLNTRFRETNNLTIVERDILDLLQAPEPDLPTGSYKVISNLPFNISKPVIRGFLESEKQPQTLVLIVQKEVAKDICAQPPDMRILSVAVQVYAEPQFLKKVPRSAFQPQPKVEGAIIRIKSRPKPLWLIAEVDKDLFFKMVRAGFQQKRKQIVNSIHSNLGIKKTKLKTALKRAGLSPARRPQTLKVCHWLRLTKQFELCNLRDCTPDLPS